jgi:SWI/SNF-related matrix-associated actin-dependent regulator of chromatin subfamily A protein 2/4
MNIRDKQERDRIKALKDNDMDAYINLINTQKNSRLMQILEQTHKYLQQLGSKVVLQKSENAMLSKKAKVAQ